VLQGLTQPNLNVVNTLTVVPLHNYAPYTDQLQANDYIFTLTSSLLWKMQRVLISIPLELRFRTPDCMQWEGSQVYVSKCWIDVANNDLWIHIFHDEFAPYTESTLTLKVRTMNLGMQNPATAGSTQYPFPIKMYNWTQMYEPLDHTAVFDRSSL